MAHTITFTRGPVGILDTVTSLLFGPDRIRRSRVYRTTRRELHALSDRELTDIGLSRRDIDTVAREAADRA